MGMRTRRNRSPVNRLFVVGLHSQRSFHLLAATARPPFPKKMHFFGFFFATKSMNWVDDVLELGENLADCVRKCCGIMRQPALHQQLTDNRLEDLKTNVTC
jgi:hypothetical protein